jgi:uncharacterized membrane protein
MSMYELWLAVHILCAVLWVGGGVSVHILGRWTMKSGAAERMIAFNHDALKLGNRFYAPLAIVLIIAGIGLVEEVGYAYSDLWITLGFLGWFFSLVVGIGYYPRQGRRIDAAIASEGPSSGAAVDGIRQVLLVNSIEILVLVLVVIDMAIKPGA